MDQYFWTSMKQNYWSGSQWCRKPHQMSIMVKPGFMKPRTYCRTCLWASAACLKSFHTSSLALSSARFSSLVIRHAALRLPEQHTFVNAGSYSKWNGSRWNRRLLLPILRGGVFTLLSDGKHSISVQLTDGHRRWISLSFGWKKIKGIRLVYLWGPKFRMSDMKQ